MRKLNVDALEVTSFETTTAQLEQSNAVTGGMCDSPWCAESFDSFCPRNPN